MLKTPLLSICIPTFNRGKYLTNCLQSILSNHELCNSAVQICVSNNGSTDDSE